MFRSRVLAMFCLTMLIAISRPQSADSSEINGLAPGWNFVALPAFHMSSTTPGNPLDIFAAYDAYGDGSGLASALHRMDALTKEEIWWNTSSFGNLLMGDGYWLRVQTGQPSNLTYPSVTEADAADWWISLPKAGITDIGNPFGYPVNWSDIMVTDGRKTVPIAYAVYTEGWLGRFFQGYDSPMQSPVNIGSVDDGAQNSRLDCAKGYRVTSMVDNIALIIPARKSSTVTYNLSGTLVLEAYQHQENIPVHADLIDPQTGKTVIRTIVYTDSAGALTIPGIKPGVYNLALKASHWLRRIVPDVSITGDISSFSVSLVNGDVNGDNSANMGDYVVMKQVWNTTTASPNWNANADLNGDGKVNMGDYVILKSNWNIAGDY